jgi:carboxypeptidase C (cathepsin A)
MSSSNPAAPRGEPIPRDVRPLPTAPNLEFERKEAKAFIKQIHAGDPDALRRVEKAHPVALRDRRPSQLQLADAQHVIAREYGFTSWPRLVEYFEEMERHRNAPRYNSSDHGAFEGRAQGYIRRHQRGDPVTARLLSHFVPRFYGRSAAEILATPITEHDAKLVVAREHRRVSWAELVERARASNVQKDGTVWEGQNTPLARASDAIRDHDAGALAAILDQHPELLAPSVIDREWRRTLGFAAVGFESKARTPEARRVTELLASRGVDIQRELNERLLGLPHDLPHHPDTERWYLDRGADPTWMPPNGITVLEHALVRYKNSACVDVIAERVTPRRALWIAAGLGDVAGVRAFIAGKGRLTAEARLVRPDSMAMGWFVGLPPNFEADDLEIMWEAFQIAGWNHRWATMDTLLDAGLPVDHAPMVWPLLIDAVGNMIDPELTQYLVGHGADVTREWPSIGSARSLARERVHGNAGREDVRRVVEICGAGTVEAILAERDANRQSPPPPDERSIRAMQLAADDAARQGQSGVTTANIVVGLLRVRNGAFAWIISGLGTDMSRLRALIGTRLLPDEDPLIGQELPADESAAAALVVSSLRVEAQPVPRVLENAPNVATAGEPGPRKFVTDHEGAFNGVKVAYRATLDETIVKAPDGKPAASLFNFAYTKRDVSNPDQRPVLFVFNGGPGASSNILHFGAFGPKRLAKFDGPARADSTTPLVPNQYTVLDVADVVMIDPPETGFSRLLPGIADSTFRSVDTDSYAISQFIARWLRDNGRLSSPIYIVGESYGSLRAVGLVRELAHATPKIDAAGLILIGHAIDFGAGAARLPDLIRPNGYLPGYAALAWYHGKIDNRRQTVQEAIEKARVFARTEWASAVIQGNRISDAERRRVATRLQELTGVSAQFYLDRDLVVVPADFNRELLRAEGKMIAGNDGREVVNLPTPGDAGRGRGGGRGGQAAPRHAMTVNMEKYLNELAVSGLGAYAGSGGGRGWSYGPASEPSLIRVLGDLMKNNPKLRLFVAQGYFDTTTEIGQSENTMARVKFPDDRSRVQWGYYAGGHMLYSDERSLRQFTDDVRKFLASRPLTPHPERVQPAADTSRPR